MSAWQVSKFVYIPKNVINLWPVCPSVWVQLYRVRTTFYLEHLNNLSKNVEVLLFLHEFSFYRKWRHASTCSVVTGYGEHPRFEFFLKFKTFSKLFSRLLLKHEAAPCFSGRFYTIFRKMQGENRTPRFAGIFYNFFEIFNNSTKSGQKNMSN